MAVRILWGKQTKCVLKNSMRPAPVDAGEEKWYSVNDAFLRARIRAWGGVSLLRLKVRILQFGRNAPPGGTESSREAKKARIFREIPRQKGQIPHGR